MSKVRTVAILIAMLVATLLPVTPAYAVNILGGLCSNKQAVSSTVCQDSNQQQQAGNPNAFIRIIKDVIDLISFIVGVAAVIMLMISSIRMVMSGGDTKAVTEGRSGVMTALAGILVVVFAQSFVVFVLDRIT